MPCHEYRMVHDLVLHDAPSSKRRARMKKDIMVNVTGDMGEMVWESLMEKEKERRKSGTLRCPARCGMRALRMAHVSDTA